MAAQRVELASSKEALQREKEEAVVEERALYSTRQALQQVTDGRSGRRPRRASVVVRLVLLEPSSPPLSLFALAGGARSRDGVVVLRPHAPSPPIFGRWNSISRQTR